MFKNTIRKEITVAVWAYKTAWEVEKAGIVIWSIVNLFGSLIPIVFLTVTKLIIDKITLLTTQNSRGILTDLFLLVAILGTALLIRGIYDIVPEVLDYIFYNKYSVAMQEKIAKKTDTIPLRHFDKSDFMNNLRFMGETVNRLAYFIAGTTIFIGNVAGITGLLWMSLKISWIFFIMAAVLIIVSGILCFKTAGANYNYWKRNKDVTRKRDYFTQLAMDRTAAKEIRLLKLGKLIVNNWAIYSEQIRKESTILNNKESGMQTIISIINFIFTGVILVTGLLLLKEKGISLGAFVMMWQLCSQLGSDMKKVATNFYRPYSFLKVLSDQKEFLEAEYRDNRLSSTSYKKEDKCKINTAVHKLDEDERDKEPVFELRNVSYYYDQGKAALKNIDLKIYRGEVVALCGNNGAGKSTLIKILLGLYAPYEGEVLFEGKPYDKQLIGSLTKRIGAMFQDYAAFQFSIRENIGFGDINKINDDNTILAAAHKGDAEKVIDKAGSLERCTSKYYDDGSIELSGGEWQRIVMSRAHMSDKDVLILDEPAAKLDPIAEINQFDRIRNMVNERTGILVSHRIGFARLADRIIVMKDGEIIEDGTHEGLMSTNKEYAEMFMQQAAWYEKVEGENNEDHAKIEAIG